MKPTPEIILQDWSKEDFSAVKNILLVTWKVAYHFIPEKDITAHIENYYSETKLNELYHNPDVKGILAKLKNKPVGWMKLFEDQLARKFYISSLYVLPGKQGMGIGKKLLDRAVKIAIKKKYNRMWLGVMSKNIPALKWYKKLDFTFVEEQPFKMGQTEVMHLIGYKIIA